MIDKADFRRECRRYRRQLAVDEYQQRSGKILHRLQTVPEFEAARTIHTFWPIEDTREVDTRPLIRQILEDGRRIVLPVVDFSSVTEPVLEHRELRKDTKLETNRWGIPEPSEGEQVPINEIDLVIVPALGADRAGHRVGYGGGFYDRFLTNVSVPTAILVYDACLTDRLAAEPHDVPASIVVTESRVLRPDQT